MNPGSARNHRKGPGPANPGLRALRELSELTLRQAPLPDAIDGVVRAVAGGTGFSTVAIDSIRDEADPFGTLMQPQFERHGVYFVPADPGADPDPGAGDEWRSDDALFA